MMSKINYISLGCPKNQVDLEYLIGEAQLHDWLPESDFKKADAIVINTCGFIEEAVNESIDEILHIQENKDPKAKLIVTGCAVERYKEEFGAELPDVDFYTGVGKLGEVIAYLNDQITQKDAFSTKESFTLSGNRFITNYNYYAYIKISEGCNNICTFCTIPSFRGEFRSSPVESIVSEAKQLIENGTKELIIVSQDTSKYGEDMDNGTSLITLLERLTSLDGDFYIRLMYINPESISDELIKHVANNSKIIKYFDIPTQHGSDKILKLMGRKYNREHLIDRIQTIRKYIPEVFIRNTFILGFPGETDVDFKDLISFIEIAKPNFAGFFIYSPEDGTPAAKLPDTVDRHIALERLDTAQKTQEKISTDFFNSFKTDFLSFIEKPSDDFEFILEGRALFQAPEIDGNVYVVDGVANNGFGPYLCYIDKFVYPDIYIKIREEEL